MKCKKCGSDKLKVECEVLVKETYNIKKDGTLTKAKCTIEDADMAEFSSIIKCYMCETEFVLPNYGRYDLLKTNFNQIDEDALKKFAVQGGYIDELQS